MFKSIIKGLLFLLAFTVNTAAAQQFYRLQADFSIKEKNADSTQRLTVGKVYYDKTYQKIVYIISFPEPEVWVIKDTMLYRFKDNKLLNKQKTFLAPEFSIFHLALSGHLADYGLKSKNELYKLTKIEKENNMVITTWLPDSRLKKYMGRIVLSNIGKKLNGIVFFNPEEKVIAKQFFKNYINLKGCEFPTTVTQFSYPETGGKNLQVTTYKNVVLDNANNEKIYNYTIPVL